MDDGPQTPRRAFWLKDTVGAFTRGRRPDDPERRRAVGRKASKAAAAGGALSVVLWLVVDQWTFTKDQVRQASIQRGAADAELVQALKDLVEAMRDKERLDDTRWAALLSRMGAPVPRPIPQATQPTRLPPSKIEGRAMRLPERPKREDAGTTTEETSP